MKDKDFEYYLECFEMAGIKRKRKYFALCNIVRHFKDDIYLVVVKTRAGNHIERYVNKNRLIKRYYEVLDNDNSGYLPDTKRNV